MAVKIKRIRQWMWAPMLAAGLVAAAGLAIAQEYRAGHPDTYVVQKGDTLWDIAGRFLKRPWLWPEIWQANPQVKNPHLIYPGDVLSLAYINRGPMTGAPIPGVPLAQVEPFLKDLRIYDKVDDLTYVVGLEEDRMRSIRGQAVYVRGLAGAQVGQRFAVLRPTLRYTRLDRKTCCDIMFRDQLNYRGRRTIDFANFWTSAVTPDNGHELLGFEMRRVNAGVITRGEVGGIEASTLLLDDPSYEVRIGDRVVPVESIPYDLTFVPHPPKQQFPYQRAQVLSVADRDHIGGPRDVVALSVGARDGIDNGTVFSIWRVGSNAVDRVKVPERDAAFVGSADTVRLPDEFAGHVMVFRTFDKVSYGLVMDGIRPTRAGYELKHPDATY